MLYALTKLKQSFADKVIYVLDAKYKTSGDGDGNINAKNDSKQVKPRSSAMKLLTNGLRSDHAM